MARKIEKLTNRDRKRALVIEKEKRKAELFKKKYEALKAKKATRRSPGAPRVNRKPTAWVLALKKWNEDKQHYTIPKKGTPGYDQVMTIKINMNKVAEVASPPEENDSHMPSASDIPSSDLSSIADEDDADETIFTKN
jgi:hypothetical protein